MFKAYLLPCLILLVVRLATDKLRLFLAWLLVTLERAFCPKQRLWIRLLRPQILILHVIFSGLTQCAGAIGFKIHVF